jgi:hypothetical protein
VILFLCDITIDVDYTAYISEAFTLNLQREGKETARISSLPAMQQAATPCHQTEMLKGCESMKFRIMHFEEYAHENGNEL